jgi:hypothetical protein
LTQKKSRKISFRFLTGRRFVGIHSLFVCSCSSKIRRRCSVNPVEIGDLYLDKSSFVLPVGDDSKALFNSPTRLNVGRSALFIAALFVVSNCCSNLVRRSSIIDDDDDDRFGGWGRSSSVCDVEIFFLVVSRDRPD